MGRIFWEAAVCLSVGLRAFGADIKIGGTLTTANGPVCYALVTCISADDTLKRFTALTDASGDFSLDVITGINPIGTNPVTFQLAPNYPNPFSSFTSIPYRLEQTSTPHVKIVNILGATIKEFNLGEQSAGSHGITWDGTNNSGKKVAAGIYFYQLTAAGKSQTRKMVFNNSSGSTSFLPPASFDFAIVRSSLMRAVSAEAVNYNVLLQSIDTTEPPIATKQITNVVIQNDTTMNFSVEELDDFALCYRGINGIGQIVLNNVKGTHPKDISNYTSGDDGYSQWSPDGRYIVFQRGVPIYTPLTIAYDVLNQTYTNLTADGGESASPPQWTPNGKVVFAYERPVLAPEATYMMNPDGSGIRKILDSVATNIYFYPDSYRFVYIMEWTRVYTTNIDGTTNLFICDLQQLMNQNEVAQGFNPSTEELLIAYISPKDTLERIAGLNITTKSIRDICISDSGYIFHQLHFSGDCSEIAAIEHSDQGEWLSVIKNGTKKRYVQIPESDPIVRFSFNPMAFSSDGQKLAYSILYFNAGSVTWKEQLYVLDQLKGSVHYVDLGWNPSWRLGH